MHILSIMVFVDMNFKVLLALSVIACCKLAAVSCDTCLDLQGSCVDKGFQCAGNKIPGKCPKNKLCCIEGEARCNALGGICLCPEKDCAGMTIPGKCPGKHTCCISDIPGMTIPGKCPGKHSCCIPAIPACTPGYTYVEEFNICIKFYNDTVNFEDAQARCINESSHLVVLDTVEKDNFILNYVRNITGGDPQILWIGLFWIEGGSENDWQWVTGQHASENFQNWVPGKPVFSFEDSCGSYHDRFYNDNVGWETEDCQSTITSVCEHDAVDL